MDRRKFLKAAGLITGAMYVDLPTFAQKVSEMGAARLRIGILSDIHITTLASADTFRHALEYFRDNNVDGVLIAGDMADRGQESELKIVADTWYSVFPKDKLPNGQHVEKLFVYGNHDAEPHKTKVNQIPDRKAELWKKYFHEKYSEVYIKNVKGYNFVGAHWNGEEVSKEAPGFIESHADMLHGEKPFFYFQHAHLRHTTYGEWAWDPDDGKVTEVLRNFPNAVAFSGHSHMPLNNEYCLWQGEFTSIGTSSLRYLCPLGARENSVVDGTHEKVPAQMEAINCDEGRQGMLLTIYDNNITIERREFVYDQPLADNWIIPWPLNGAQMSFENRKKKAVAPEFAEGDKVSVRYIKKGKDRYGVKQEQVEARFPTVTTKRTGGVHAIDYEVQIEREFIDTLEVVCSKRVYSPGFFFGEAQDDKDVVCLFGEKEIPVNKRWRFVARPCESFSKRGKPIYSEWQGEYND